MRIRPWTSTSTTGDVDHGRRVRHASGSDRECPTAVAWSNRRSPSTGTSRPESDVQVRTGDTIRIRPWVMTGKERRRRSWSNGPHASGSDRERPTVEAWSNRRSLSTGTARLESDVQVRAGEMKRIRPWTMAGNERRRRSLSKGWPCVWK